MNATATKKGKTLLVQCHTAPPERLRLDEWHPWTHVTDRDQTVCMAAHRFAREYGLLPSSKLTVYVYHALTTDPKHPSGQPICVMCTETIVSRD
jgi:hypothetical protein